MKLARALVELVQGAGGTRPATLPLQLSKVENCNRKVPKVFDSIAKGAGGIRPRGWWNSSPGPVEPSQWAGVELAQGSGGTRPGRIPLQLSKFENCNGNFPRVQKASPSGLLELP